METICDNTSVGAIIRNKEGAILLLGRARFPFGLAPPAGHIDDHGNAEQATAAEIYEEVGLEISVTSLKKVIESRRINNQCRRAQGNHHIWDVYETTADGDLNPSVDETLGAGWYLPGQLEATAARTAAIGDRPAERGELVLEQIWFDMFAELGIITPRP